MDQENIHFSEAKNDKVEGLASQINTLQIEKKNIEDEFGLQRAKMKDLYLQKENEFKQQLIDQENKLKSEIKKLQNELDECRSQLTVSSLDFQSRLEAETRKYKEELQSLQHLLQETVEESSGYENEIKRLNFINSKLAAEVNELKNTAHTTGGEMPQILSVPTTVISQFARKVTNQITTQLGNADNSSGSSNGVTNAVGTSASLSQFSDTDTLDDSMRKAQEDAAVLRSLVVPLEEEIKALKDKLREMDVELRKYQQNDKNLSALREEISPVSVGKIIDLDNNESSVPITIVDSSTFPNKGYANTPGKTQNLSSNSPRVSGVTKEVSSSDKKSPSFSGCDMCSNYEGQLLNAQQKIHDLEKHVITLERYKQELSKETAFRKDMEEKWNEKKEEYKEKVKALQFKTEKAEQTLKDLRATFSSTYDGITQQIRDLCHDREKNQKELTRLQKENDSLVGKYKKHSQQLQNEIINLPNSVEELQELILRNQEELIAAKIAKEQAEEMVATLTEEIAFLRDQSQTEEQARMELESTLMESINKLRADVQSVGPDKNNSAEAYQQGDRKGGDIRKEMKQFSTNLDKLTKSNKYFEDTVNELRTRISSLQTELDNSEKVQKDFVLLSQSLQQELEKIRGAETEVRWEHDEDITECKRCKNQFSVTRRKLHCRHCGRIFCQSCLTRTVNSGPNNRPSKVCDVCHTLLDRDSAPYFSTVPPPCD